MREELLKKERKNKYNAKSHEDEGLSLRLPVDYTRAGILDDIVDSYSVLTSKGRTKTQFIVEAIKCIGMNPKRLTSIEEYIYEAKKMDILRLNRGLETIEDYKEFFESEECEKNLRSALEPFEKPPAKMTLGFNRNLKDSRDVYDALGLEAPRERVTIISNAVLTYIKKGFDVKGLSLLADKTLYEMMQMYRVLDKENRDELLETLGIILEESKRILNKKGKEEERASTTEIQRYFI